VLTVRVVDYNNLPENLQDTVPSSYYEEIRTHYLLVEVDGNIIRVENDCMEPEDATFYRDLYWIKDAIEKAYEIGKDEGYEDALIANGLETI
jgi:hypothetical protein